MTVYRFMYRRADSSVFGPYDVPLALTSSHTPESAAALVSEWNQRDRGKRVWRCDECLPGDIDHPEEPFKTLEPFTLTIVAAENH